MGQKIDGKAVSAAVRAQVSDEVSAMAAEGTTVTLAVVIVGDDPASRVYVNNKKRACAECGIRSEEYALGADTTQEELMRLVDELNGRADVNGILVQLPLPKHLDEKQIIEAIDPQKDVDAFHPSNVGRIMIGDYHFLPCTPAGVMELIHSTGVSVGGADCAVIGRSNIVGKPMAMLMMHENATVTICNSRTQNLPAICKEADVVVVAMGKMGAVGADCLRESQTVVDVGIHVNEKGKLCGDVKFSEAEPVVDAITPVPGGVGAVTSAVLMRHVVLAAERGRK